MKFSTRIACAGAIVLLAGTSVFAQSPPEPAIYIHAGTLLDRPGREPRGPATIIVRAGRIEAVRDGHVAPEAGARLVNLGNQFVLPGLIDMHVHIFNDDDKMLGRYPLARPCAFRHGLHQLHPDSGARVVPGLHTLGPL